MLETTEFKEMKEHIEELDNFNKRITEKVVNTCEKLGRYVTNWGIVDDWLIVIYNNYKFDTFWLYV